MNNFGLWKECLYCPSHDSDALISPEDLYRPHISAIIPKLDRPEIDEPCLSSNKTVDMLLNWQHDSSPGKSNEDLDTLVHDILLHPDFDLRELKSFNVAHENQKYDAKEQTHLLSFQHMDIKIDVPSGSSLVAP